MTSTSPTWQQIIKEFYDPGEVVAAFCHGLAALLNVVARRLTLLGELPSHSNVEEEQAGYTNIVPYLVESQ